jgi:hypothetical protein
MGALWGHEGPLMGVFHDLVWRQEWPWKAILVGEEEIVYSPFMM